MSKQLIFSIQVLVVCMLNPFISFSQDALKTIFLEEVEIEMDTIPADNYLLSVDQYMQQRNDIQLIKRGNFAYEPIVEGFTDGQITVAIDGMRVFGACTDKMDPATSYLEPVNLKKLTVLKENESQMYGTSLGGTVTAEMKYPELKNGFHAGTQTAYSSNTNGFDGNIFIEESTEKWGIRYSGAYRNHQSYKDGHGEIVDYTQYKKQNHTLTSRYSFTKSDELTMLFMYDHGQDIGYPALNMDVSSAKAIMGNIGYSKHFDKEHLHHLEAKVYFNDIHHVMDDTQRENVAIHMDMPGQSTTMGAWSALHWNFEKHKTTAKLDFYSNHLFADMTMYSPNGGADMYMLTWGDIQRNALAFSINDQWQLESRLKLMTNIRIETATSELQNEEAKKQFETVNYFIDGPRNEWAGSLSGLFQYDLTSQLQAKFGVSYTSRMPSASELYGFYLFNASDRYDYIGTPDLENEKVTSFDFTLQYQEDLWGVGVRTKWAFIHDYIVGIVDDNYSKMTPDALGVKRYQNIDNAKTSHLEFFAYLQIHKQLKYDLSLVNEHGFIDELHSSLPYQRPLTIKQSLNFQVKRFTTTLFYEYSIGMKDPSEILGEQTTDPYHLVNLDFTYALKMSKMNCFIDFGIHNLLNAYYVDPFAWNEIPSIGRNLKASIRVNI